ncbi:inositol monophosphatase family protein [Microcoleus sp. LEGE 07076]|uniref:3'(2'),5'-bisphosphate nucleotidase CysQ family protein n=1 Tax=Microcoleus sp. LEGE 07076 TaxID=915322 RepID=UPI001881D80B|nr:inositol monophosphatase family protein [Microcoleus sp. LEGE 07076]MBE9184436.1 inositol monophosphatase family protein [Microcoleus sp. LEGE 07076]
MYISPEQDQKIRYIMRECGQEACKLAAQPFEVCQKGPDDYVTSIDRYLDGQLSAAFNALFPEDGTIAEENIASRAAYSANYQRLWCIDPIDGTEGFIQGKQHYAVMVGLLVEAEPVAGWIYAPAFDKMYFGGKDWGLFQSVAAAAPQPIAPCQPPAPTAKNCKIILGDKDQKNYARAIAQSIPGAEFYSLGSFGLKVMEVIQGRAGLYLYFNGRVKVWDTAGPLALAKAAGLVCCDLQGQPLRWTKDAIEPESLAHTQSIAIGWPDYIESLLGKVQKALTLL